MVYYIVCYIVQAIKQKLHMKSRIGPDETPLTDGILYCVLYCTGYKAEVAHEVPYRAGRDSIDRCTTGGGQDEDVARSQTSCESYITTCIFLKRFLRSRASKFSSVFKIDSNGNFVGLLYHSFRLQLVLAIFWHHIPSFTIICFT